MAKKIKKSYDGRKWNEWTPEERMTKEEIINALEQLANNLLAGGVEKCDAGQAILGLAYNLEVAEEGDSPELLKKCERIYAIKKILEEPPKSHELEEIREIRKRTGQTLEKFAKSVGISKDTAESLVIGRLASSSQMNRILQLLDWDMVSLD